MYEAFIALISSMNKKIHNRIQQVKDSIPTKVSQLMNDKKYTTESQLKVTTDVANTALIIAKGANKALSYGDYNTMITSLNTMTKDALNPGQNIMIVTLEVPDLWVHSVSSNSIPYEYTSDQKLLEDMNSNSGILQVGYYILSQLETQKVDLSDYKTKDVQIDGTSIVNEDGVAKIPFGSKNGYNSHEVSPLGLVKTLGRRSGLGINYDGGLFLTEYEDDWILTNRYYSYVCHSRNYDQFVRHAMCDGIGAKWTDTEKSAAWSRLSSIKTTMDEVAVAGARYLLLGEQTEVSVVLPDDALTGQEITVAWYNGETPATLSITGNMLDFDFTPTANTRSEISALFDGTYWSVIGMSQDVPVDTATEEVVASE